MKTVSIHELKRRLAALVHEAGRGERIVITRHRRPVASLTGRFVSLDASQTLAAMELGLPV